MKCQRYLRQHLANDAEQLKESCNSLQRSNIRLEAEIKHDELQLKGMIAAYDSISNGKVNIHKDLLEANDKKKEFIERVRKGEMKYKQMWVEAKARYETISYVQKYIEKKTLSDDLNHKLKTLEDESERLKLEVKVKRNKTLEMDKKLLIEVAKYMTHERSNKLKAFNEMKIGFNEMAKEVNALQKEVADNKTTYNLNVKGTKEALSLDDWPKLCSNFDNTLKMPTLQLRRSDLDVFSANLKQIRDGQGSPVKRKEIEILKIEKPTKRAKINDVDDKAYISTFFNVPYSSNNLKDKTIIEIGDDKKKFIQVLEDVNIEMEDVVNIVTNINTNTMTVTDVIKGKQSYSNDEKTKKDTDTQANKDDNEEDIEEIDMSLGSQNALLPPTQFKDASQEFVDIQRFEQRVEAYKLSAEGHGKPPYTSAINGTYTLSPTIVEIESSDKHDTNPKPIRSSQEAQRKRVSFHLPAIEEENETQGTETQEGIHESNLTNDSELNLTDDDDGRYNKLMEMFMTKTNFSASPDFVYAKNNIAKAENRVVTSKFFNYDNPTESNTDNKAKQPSKEAIVNPAENKAIVFKDDSDTIKRITDKMEAEKVAQSEFRSILPKAVELETSDKGPRPGGSVSSPRFGNGLRMATLNVSINTTGSEDADGDFQHCIDSSLLLSPKADLPTFDSTEKNGDNPQAVPNFLSGLRNTGLSFFRAPSTNTEKPDSSAQADSGNNFNFNFGGDEKKSRGGLFNLFR